MRNQKGISLITLIIIIAIVVIGIIFISANNSSNNSSNNSGNNQGNRIAVINWGAMPSTEFYELKLAATQSEVYGAGKGTFSLASFNTLGRDVKNAGGKWFKDSSVNFRARVLDNGNSITLTDGEHVAAFMYTEGKDTVDYFFADEDFLEEMNMAEDNLLGGYKITIK